MAQNAPLWLSPEKAINILSVTLPKCYVESESALLFDLACSA